MNKQFVYLNSFNFVKTADEHRMFEGQLIANNDFEI